MNYSSKVIIYMIERTNITVITVCDNHYAIMLAALIKSIEVNHLSGELINLHIVDDHISKKTRNKISACTKTNKINISWHKIENVIPKGTILPLDETSYPLNMYARLFIPYFLDETISKAIYVDVDMIVNSDISELWNISMNDKIIGGVVDQLKIIGGEEWTAISNYKELGLNSQSKYFNSGLLVMDVLKWRTNDITSKIFKCIEQNKEFIRFPDQYGLNVVFIDQWHEFDAKWNAYANQDIEKPAIVHFIMTKPIYKTYNLNKRYEQLFWTYLNQTPFAGFRPMSKFRYYLQKGKIKINKKLLKIFN